MNVKTMFGSCITMALFVACQQENENVERGNWPMSIAASIESPINVSNSRYAGNEPSAVDFEISDSIGVFLDSGGLSKWIKEETGWTVGTSVYWPDKTREHTFFAYYPYAKALSATDVPMPSLLGQSGTIESISQCDFLVASVSQSYGPDGVVRFQDEHAFTHVSTLLQLNLKGEGDLSAAVIHKIAVTGANIVAPASYSFMDETVTLTPDESSDQLEASLDYQMVGKDHSFYFIVNEKMDAAAPVSLTIEYVFNEKNYVATLENFAGNVFEGGMRQNYTITIKDSSILIEGASISAWGEGERMDDIVLNGEEKSE